jgi:hypothetical protein
VELGASADYVEFDAEKANKWMRDEVPKIALMRKERTRKLNEKCQREAEQAKLARGSPRGEHTKVKPGVRPELRKNQKVKTGE